MVKLFSELLPNQEHLKLQDYQLDRGSKCITLFVCSTQSTNVCPLCEQTAYQVHSRYARKLADLAWADTKLRLRLGYENSSVGMRRANGKSLLNEFLMLWNRGQDELIA